MANYLENLLAKSIMSARIDVLQDMVRKDVNLIDWSIRKWSWLPNMCRALKPIYGNQFMKIDHRKIMLIISRNRPDMVPYISEEWIKKQVHYAKWYIANKI